MNVPSVADLGAPKTRGVRAAYIHTPLHAAFPIDDASCNPRMRLHICSLRAPMFLFSPWRLQNFYAVNFVSALSVIITSWLFVTLLRRRRILHI